MENKEADGPPNLSCETTFSGANEDRKYIFFSYLNDHEQSWQRYPVDPYAAENATIVGVAVDLHIQCIVLVTTEETTVTQQVTLRPVKHHSFPLVVTKRCKGQRVTSW